MIENIGRLPPQAIDLEMAVLGAIMLEKDSLIEIIDILSPECFYKDSHQKIYKAIIDLQSSNEPIDMLTISQQLQKSNNLEDVGGYAYLSNLTGNIASSSHIEVHARIVQQKYIKRELIRVASEVLNKAYDDSIDVNDLLEFNESELFKVANNSIKKEPELIGEIGKKQLVLLEKFILSNDQFRGLPTNLKCVDDVMKGLQDNKLIIIAARPGMGKTTLIVSISFNISVIYKESVAIFSLEMGNNELWNKCISHDTGITYAKIAGGDLSNDEWILVENSQRKLEEANLFIDDTPAISLFEIRAKARRLKQKHGIKLIVIDYLQLMTGEANSGSREQEISKISRGLKQVSKELEIPVVALSQLNRLCESRPDKKPQLSDLRESGAIEQDADIVIFIHRPEYYGFTTYDNDESTINKVDIIFAKHRGGKTMEVSADRTPNFSKIYDKSNDGIEDIKPVQDNTDITPDLEF